eukprot:CAMPEP_0170478774 /NCGR_PEP_ID=MMETSP0208-20121228/239_1 /TAXON_ID=197538 /ORGANISM="Strombidium inclinatum, Strain S3" /LENGTH=292 /DNA_ID=CAMNT_0010751085 /DNA_START=14 /DNA_END=892 /DNA_ORIENTATION=-
MSWDLKKAIGHKFEPYELEITNKDMILYALGIGFQRDPLNEKHFNFTYESADEFQSFPTMNVIIAHRQSGANLTVPGIPAFNPMVLLHGEESLEVFSPIESDTTVLVEDTLVDVQDKGKAFILVYEVKITNKETKELIAKIHQNLFVRAKGGFGHKGTIKNEYPEPPKRAPCASIEEVTTKDQAFLYRLSGDLNPLHVDPQMSAMGGFKVPILHGLCTYGVTAKAVQEKFFPDDPQQLKKFTARFTSHVFPGETLVVEMWKEGKRIILQSKTKERGLVVLKGFVDMKDEAKM